MKNNNYVAIMAGGIGSRFWPISRSNYPKQFIDILGTGSTLLQSTYERFCRFIPKENIYVVTSAEYTIIVKDQLPTLPEANIVGEPQRKNTAACIALISKKLEKLNPEANLIVAPSDHTIENEAAFQQNCIQALEYTQHNDAFVTLGIKPTYANTGYGYIQYDKTSPKNNIYTVKRFTEKPNKETAKEFINNGDYLWNSGLFIWKAKDVNKAFENYMPDMYQYFQNNYQDLNTPSEPTAVATIYRDCESISIDYAILEKAKNVYVIPADFGWSDLGTWNSAWENFEKDTDQNAVAGVNTLLMQAHGNIVHSTDKKLIVVGGVDDLIIVNTPDAILICKKENEQQIKDYLVKIKEYASEKYL